MKKRLLNLDYETKVYVIITGFIFFVVYGTILLSGKIYMYTDIGADTFGSYWPSIAYVKNLLLDMKFWDMKLGLGAPTATYISMFLSDPFNWICFLFDNQHIDVGLWIGLALKYLFLAYYSYQYIGIKNITGRSRTICSLMITFCGWFVGWGQHYHFATAFLLWIVLLYYFECWLHYGQYFKLILSVMLLTMIMPYYSYMSLLFLVFYYFISLYFFYHKEHVSIKNLFFHSMKTAAVIITGILCSAVIFFPWVGDAFSSPRVGGRLKPSFDLGEAQEYLSIVMRLFSNSILGVNVNFAGYSNFYECPFMYIGILFVLLIPFFLITKKFLKNYWFIIGGIIFVFLYVNISSIVFSAFSDKVYRWTYLFVPIFVLMCGKCLDYNINKYDKRIVIAEFFGGNLFLLCYGYWYYRKFGFSRSVLISLSVVFLILNLYILLMLFIKNKIIFYNILLIIVTIDLCSNAYITVHGRGIIRQSDKPLMGYFDDSNEAINYLKDYDNDFYRISKNYNLIDLNDSMIQNYNGEKLYSSVLTGEIWNLMYLFDLRIQQSSYFYGFDDKQILRNLSVGKYRLTKSPNEYYGYEKIYNTGNVYIYQNKNSFNFGTIYDNYVLETDLVGKNQFDKQTCLLYNCVINNEDFDKEIQNFNRNTKYNNIDNKLIYEVNTIQPNKNTIKLNEDNSSPFLLEITGENAKGSIEIISKGTEQYEPDNLEFTIGDEVKTFYIDNLNVKKLIIKNNEGNVKNIRLYQINGKELEDKIEDLNQESLQVSNFSDTNIKANIECLEEKILFIPIPFNKNWNVFINGESTKVYRADAGFMAVVLPEGNSEIIIKYEANYFFIGCFVSCISFIGLISVYIFTKLKKRKTH